MLRTMIVVLVAGGLAQASLAQRASVGFYRVGSDYSRTRLTDMSDDGAVAVGIVLDPQQPGGFAPLRWTFSSGTQPLLRPPGHSQDVVKALSGDGRVAFSESLSVSAGLVVARYGPNGLIDTFAGMPGWQQTLIYGADFTGHTFVGRARLANPNSYGTPIIWHDGQYRSLSGIPGYGGTGEAAAVSDDGLTVVVNGQGDLSSDVFRWRSDAGYELLSRLPGSEFAGSSDASGSAEWIVGYCDTRPVRWSPDGSVLNLDPQHMFEEALAQAVSADGRTVVGYGRIGGVDRAFYWSEEAGMSLLSEFLTGRGIGIPAGLSLIGATKVSADGLVISGDSATAALGDAWVVVIPSPASCAALVFGLTLVTRRSRNSRSTSAA